MITLVVCAVVCAAVSARAERLAVLQIEAPGLLPAAREEMENQVRLGLKDAGVDVQDGAATAGFVKEAAAAGLACSLAEEECALKVAVAADVDGVVVGRSVSRKGKSALELTLATLEGKHQSIAGSEAPRLIARRLKDPHAGPATPLPQPLLLEPEDAGLVVDGQDAVVDDDVVWLTPGAHTLTLGHSGYDSRVVVVDVPGDRLPAPASLVLERSFPLMTGVGLVTAGGGVGITALFGLLTLLVEADLADGVAQKDLEATRGTGQVFLAVTGVGVAAIGVGAAVAIVGGLE